MLRRALTIAFAVAAIALGSSTSASAVATVGVSRQSANAQNDLVALVNAYRASNELHRPCLFGRALADPTNVGVRLSSHFHVHG